MRYSEFWSLVDDVFGAAYGPTLVRTQVLTPLGATGQEALDAGVEPRDVWRALCDAMDVPESRRWGSDEPRRRNR